MTWGLIIAIIFLVLFIIILLTLGEGLLKVTASQSGVDASDYSVMPISFRSFLGRSNGKKTYVPEGAEVKNLSRGFDISLLGTPELGDTGVQSVRTTTYALKPGNFVGMSPIPKVVPEVGTQVKAGDALLFDKKRPEIIYAAPISGEIIEIKRGAKRAISEVIILADRGEVQYRSYDNLPNLDNVSREELVGFLLPSGVWPFIRQRPFDTVAEPIDTPKAIFVSTFDTAPLAPDLNLAVEGKEEAFHAGLRALTILSGGKVHVGLNARGQKSPAAAYINAKNIEGVETHWFNGQHPAGNVGVHIHHIDPVLPGSMVWHLDVHGVILLGTLLTKGIFDTERVVALSGAELANPSYVRVHQGVNLAGLLEDLPTDISEQVKKVKDKEGNYVETTVAVRTIRIVSGDLLSGEQVERSSFLNFYDDQVSVAKEGDYYELFGWLVPQTGHPSMSRTFPNGFFPDAQYVADTNTNGEKRAFVMTGEYESVLPMDIFPQYVFRAIQANDFEKMEGLGILELSEEDVALCEYVCTSKQPLQQILRQGLEEIRNS